MVRALLADVQRPAEDSLSLVGGPLLTVALELPPAACTVVGDDLPEHREEGVRVDRLRVAQGHCPSRLVIVTGGDDPSGSGTMAPS